MYYTFKYRYGTQKDPPIGNLRLNAANDYLSFPPYSLFLFLFVGHFFGTVGFNLKLRNITRYFFMLFFYFISFI